METENAKQTRYTQRAKSACTEPLLEGFQRFSELFRGFQRFSEIFRGFQGTSQRQTSLSEALSPVAPNRVAL